MRFLKKILFSIFLAAVAILLIILIVLNILNICKTKDFNGAGQLVLMVFCLFLILAIFKESLLALNTMKDTLKCKENNSELIERKEISNSLDQFQQKESFQCKYSKADVEFLKTLLLPIKAELIKGLQGYKVDKHIALDKLQYNYIDESIQFAQQADIYSALKYLKEFFDEYRTERNFCSYNELIVGAILTTNIICLCDAKLLKIAESEKHMQSTAGTKLIQEAAADEHKLLLLPNELVRWHEYFSSYTIQEYFKLSDAESDFLRETIQQIFSAIVQCRKKNMNIRSYIRQHTKQTPCFFSVLGAPGRSNELDFKKKAKVKIHEKRKSGASC